MTRPELLDSSPSSLPMEMSQTSESPAPSNIYRIAWQRKSLLILGLVIGVVIGALYYSQKDPAYQSTSLIAVLRKNPNMLPMQDPRTMVMDDYVTFHAQLLRTPLILRSVVQDNDIKKLETFTGKSLSDMMTLIMGGLLVNRDTRDANARSPILQLTFKGPNANDCQSILDGIIKHYKTYLKVTYENQGSDLLQSIKNYERILKDDLARLSKQHQTFRDQNRPVMSSKEGKNPIVSKLESLLGERIKIRQNVIDITTRLKVMEEGAQAKMGLSLLYLMPSSSLVRQGQEGASMPVMNTSEQLMRLQVAQKTLASKVGPNHPDLKDLALQIDSLEKYLSDQTKELNATGQAKDSLTTRETPIQSALNSFKLELKRLEMELKAIDEEISHDWEDAKEMSKVEMVDQDFENSKRQYNELLSAVLKQISTAKLFKDDEVYYAQIMQEPTLAQKVEPRLLVIMTLSVVLGLLGGFGLAYLADMTDKSFRSPEEIRRRLNIPVIGHVPMLLSEEESAKLEGAINGPDPTLVTYYRPKSRKAEVFRGIRTALYFSTRGEGHKVIQITSPNMGDGKTTLSSNLAVSIAQSGKQTILIDADFRRPRLHKYFAVPSEKGFASVLTGQCDLRDAIQPTVIPGLSVLPCGPIPPNPAELLTSPRFKELMDELREQYDYVIVDTPPLLVVTDPCAVAPRVDGVLLTMRVVKNGRPIAERAKDILLSLGAKPLGIVVNGVAMTGPSGIGYGYGYGYGYGQYDYAQAYQYKYEYSDRYYAGYGDEGYYQDREATEITPEMPHSAGAANRLPTSEPTNT
jgi:succinoglycan biosynthesis transport protein ExoP